MLGGWFGSSAPSETIYPELPSPKTNEDYKKVIAEAREKVLSLHSSTGSEWVSVDTTLLPDNHGVTINSKNDGTSAIECIRAVKLIHASPKAVFELVSTHDIASRRTWDPELLDFKFIKAEEDGVGVVYAVHNAPFPVTKRDFILAITHSQEPSGTYLAFSTSINYAGVNQDTNYVRGALYVSAWVIEAVEGKPDEALVTRIIQVDPKGMIPAFVVNANKSNPGKVLVQIENLLAKK
eukprot:TRINITY_DN3865_c0_g1_i1.p2 TRINITY_DN3865_c0_g1~~TRINITY_DN3865_c0_g1_i1.p2  ORF type:complete len:272 (-),score=80.66 TRINITY_DN3865_c0_g1_i1:296-1006(-)